MEWAPEFYGQTGRWWGPAESRITERDERRVEVLHGQAGSEPQRILELGSGYGATAAVTARAGHTVTAVELTDRADFAQPYVEELAGRLTMVRGDFYDVDLGPHRFDAVTYWNGFGIGTDADQRRLLSRIARDWLTTDGVAVVDVYNPFVWARWHGDREHRDAAPERGYAYDVDELTEFDPIRNRASDSWWESARPERVLTQHLRCYTPADLVLLLEGTGLALRGLVVGGRQVDPAATHYGNQALLRDNHEYAAVLVRTPADRTAS